MGFTGGNRRDSALHLFVSLRDVLFSPIIARKKSGLSFHYYITRASFLHLGAVLQTELVCSRLFSRGSCTRWFKLLRFCEPQQPAKTQQFKLQRGPQAG